MRLDIERTTLNITTYCNLNCKHCVAFIPYFKEKSHLSYGDASKVLEEYFKVIDTVEFFTITGGEPLLNREAFEIVEKTYEFRPQILRSVNFVTNGTLMIPEKLLALFERNREFTKVIISDYGKNLSTNVGKIEAALKYHDIPYRVSSFSGDNTYYGGWISFLDHSLKWKSETERDENAQKCIQRIGKYFVIYDGEIHCCSRSYWRMKNGIIPKTTGEYVPLTDGKIPLSEKKRLLFEMHEMASSTSCAYCVGFRNDIPRVTPAQQLDVKSIDRRLGEMP